MQRRVFANWLPLVALLLASPLLSACPGGGAGQAALQPFHIKPLPDYSPYQERPDPAIKAIPPADRRLGTTGRPFPGYQAPRFFAPQHPAGKQPPYTPFIAGGARHFQLFPTGPPPHH
jgi:hypothetical protein